MDRAPKLKGEEVELDESMYQALDDHLAKLRTSIATHAIESVPDGDESQVDLVRLAKAIERYAPGTPLPMTSENKARDQGSFAKLLSPVTKVSAMLAVVFAVAGLLAIGYGGSYGIDGTGFLDIAKIFAGAVVGSTTASAAAKS